MNKKEVLEIRKILKKEDTRIDRIAACYINGEKKKVSVFQKSFLTLPEEEMFKYSDLFRKLLSGSVGKNLLSLEFPLEEETEGTYQKRLLKLRDTALQDEEVLEEFFDSVLASYLHPENYIVLLGHGVYDVPGRTSDGQLLNDASDYVYSFILCALCPVNLSKPGLIYSAADNDFIDKIQDHMVQMPEIGFLFPAFRDRNSDIHSLLYYAKNTENSHPEIAGEVLGCTIPMSAGDQKKAFDTLIEETFKDDCTLELTQKVQEKMNALLEGKKEDPEPTPLGKKELTRFMEDCGADAGQIKNLEKQLENQPEEDFSLLASNLTNPKRFTVKMPDIRITADASAADEFETRRIDGRDCLIIPLSGEVIVNGIRIQSKAAKENGETTEA